MSAPTLHAYQRDAVEFLHRHPRGALFMEMGLGKTATVLSALTPSHLPALVVAPKRVAEHVWPAEAQVWRPDLSVALAAGSPVWRAACLSGEADVVVIGRDNLADALKTPQRWRTIVLDELSGFKNRSTARWKAANKLTKGPLVHSVWGLTGTPAPNGLLDLWAQLMLIDRGQALGRTLTGYRERYFHPTGWLPNGTPIKWKPRPGAAARIQDQLRPVALSMRAADLLDLPPVTYRTVDVSLPRPARRAYADLVATMVAQLDDGTTWSAATAATLSNRLTQVTAGFMYPDRFDAERGAAPVHLHDAKTDAVVELVDGATGGVLVFYRYEYERARLAAAMPQARDVRDAGAIEAWNAGRLPVLLAHPASAGHGLNLQHGGHTIVWATLTWSLEEWQQGNARLARQGQTSPVIVHVVRAVDTIDKAIAARLAGKAGVQDALMAHLRGRL